MQHPSVIVTGSSGLLGRPVCERLAQQGYQVFGFDRVGLPEPPKAQERVQDIECDLIDSSSVRAAVSRIAPMCDNSLASVVHMAAYYDFSGEESDLYREVTINGTDRLLNALQGFDLDQFLFTSTMLIHAPCEVGKRISEEDPLEAKWPYPVSKAETERLIREGHPNVRSVFLRIAGVYTDYGRQPTIVQQIKRIYEKELQGHFFPGNTDAGQSAVHVEDAVDAIVRTVDRRDSIAPRTAILIGEPDPVPYSTLQDRIGRRLYGKEWATMEIPKPVAKVGAAMNDLIEGGDAFIKPYMVDMADDHYALDISRAREMLDWEPQHRLSADIDLMIDRLKADPDKWYQQNGLERP